MATQFVRVKDKTTRHESTVTKAFAEAHPNDLEVLAGKKATDGRNRPLPGKPYVELAKAAPNKEGK